MCREDFTNRRGGQPRGRVPRLEEPVDASRLRRETLLQRWLLKTGFPSQATGVGTVRSAEGAEEEGQ